MKRLPIALMFLFVLIWAMPAPAQLFFGKKTKPNPTQRVPELIVSVKTEPDERKRAHAAEELRDYDTAVFAEIVPVLADVLLHDKKVSVRVEALTSLTKIRPVSIAAGRAIEKAAAADDSLRVRLQAKAALPKYHLAVYTSKSAAPAPATVVRKQTEEPPLAGPPSSLPPRVAPMAPKAVAPTTPAYPPIPRPFPPVAAPPVKTPAPPAQGPSLFPD